MASKGRRDVDLVIRAKNEASKAIGAVSDALDTLTGKQKKAGESATATGSTLEKLGTELGKLTRAAAGLSVMDRLDRSMTKAQGAAERLEKSVSSLEEKQKALTAEIKDSETTLAGLTAQQKKAQAGYDRQKAKVDKAKAAQAAYRKELTAAKSALRKAETTHTRLGAAFEKQVTKLREVAAAQNQAAAAVDKAEEPTRQQIADYERLSAAYDKQKAKVDAAAEAWIEAAGAADKADAALQKAQSHAAKLAANLDKQKAAQKASANTLKQVSDQASAADGHLTKLRGEFESLTSVQARETDQLEKSRAGMAELGEAAEKAQASLAKVASITRSRLLRVLADGQSRLSGFKTAWESATASIAESARGGATPASSPVMAAQVQQAKAAKQAYLTLRDALQQMRKAVRDAGGDINKLSEAQQTFLAQLERVEGAEREVVGSTERLAAAAREAASAESRMADQTGRTGAAMDRAAAKNRKFAATLDAIGLHSRKSMNWIERMRSEVTALATAYIGLFAAIQQAGGVIDSIRTVQGAEQKLGVAFGGDMAKARQELAWLHDQALRLGASFKDLIDEYSSFAVAVNQSPKLAGKARQLFLPFVEAGVVMHADAEQMKLIGLALQQMVNKGSVQMQELKRQLGDQLAGAFELAAKSAGFATSEFGKLVATGQVITAGFLSKFAAQIRKTFGKQLPEAVKSLNSEIGRFQTHLFDMQQAVAGGGFLEGLTDVLGTMNKYFASSEGEKFFENVGAAAGVFFKLIAAGVTHLDAITAIFKLWLARRFAGIFTSLASDLRKYVAVAKTTPTVMAASTRALERNATAANVAGAAWQTMGRRARVSSRIMLRSARRLTVARAAAGALTGAMGLLRGALAALGGIPGLVITGITFALTAWLSKTDDLVDANDLLAKTIGKVQSAFNDADKSAKGWLDTVEKMTKGDIIRGLQKAAESMKQYRQGTPLTPGGSPTVIAPASNPYAASRAPVISKRDLSAPAQEMNRIAQAFHHGKINADEYKKELSDLLAKYPKMNKLLRGQWDALNKNADKAVDLSKKIKVLQAVQAYYNGTATKSQKALIPWVKSTEDATDAQYDLAAAIKAVNQLNPENKPETQAEKHLEKLDLLVRQVNNSVTAAQKGTEAYKKFLDAVAKAKTAIEEHWDAKNFQDVIKAVTSLGNGKQISAALIRHFEGFTPGAKYDVNAYRAGFGSDTITLSDGTIQKITKGMTVTLADAQRDLARRIDEFQTTIKGQIGTKTFNAFTPQQQAVLTSVAYNYGSLPDRIVKAVRTGSTETIAAAIKALGKDNGGIRKDRYDASAYLFSKGANFNPKGMERLESAQIKKAEAFHAQLSSNLDVMESQNAVAKKRTMQEEVTAALLKAQNKARKAGTKLTEDEVQRIIAVTEELYSQKHALDDIKAAKKKQRDLEKKDRDLAQLRNRLIQQGQLAQQSGDLAGYEAIRKQIAEVNAQLQTAIRNEIAFWNSATGQSLAGSPEAAAAHIAELELRLKGVEQAAMRAKIAFLGLTTGDIANALRTNVISAVGAFIDKIGEAGLSFKTLGDAFRQFAADFLKQIAKMILQQAIFNALQMAGKAVGGTWGSILSAAGGAVQHTGGVTGKSASRRRTVAASWFQNAARYHNGGIPGLAPNEIPTILKKGEEVLTQNDPRHVANGGKMGGAANVKIVNAIDAGSFISEGLNDPVGGKSFFNFIRANSTAVRRSLGIS